MKGKQGRLSSRERWLITGMTVSATVAAFLAWAWATDLVPYEDKWGNYADWVSALSTFFGFGAAVVTIAITRRKYDEEREQFLAGERSREEREKEIALGVHVELRVETITKRRSLMSMMRRKDRGDLRYVCLIENNTSFNLDNIQIVYPEPNGTDREEWDYFATRTFPTQKAGAVEAYSEDLPPSHPSRWDCLALFESMYSVQFTLNGTRWERNKLGLRALEYSWALQRH